MQASRLRFLLVFIFQRDREDRSGEMASEFSLVANFRVRDSRVGRSGETGLRLAVLQFWRRTKMSPNPEAGPEPRILFFSFSRSTQSCSSNFTGSASV
jgi:hypothetical protein